MTNLEDFIIFRRSCIKALLNTVYGLHIPRGRFSFSIPYNRLSTFFNTQNIALRACSNLTKFYIYSGQPTNIPEIKITNGVKSNYMCIDDFSLKEMGLI